MADATESRELLSRNLQLRMTRKLTVAAATTIYAGQIVGIDAFGEAVHATTTLKVAGIAVSDAVAGDVTHGSTGAVHCGLPARRVRHRGARAALRHQSEDRL